MRYIKKYENVDDVSPFVNKNEVELKKLLSFFIEFFESFGYDYSNFYDSRNWETEFYMEKKLHFSISVEYTYENIIEILLYKEIPFVMFILEYLRGVNGLKIKKDSNKYNASFVIVDDVDNITKNITKEDFNYKFNLYNNQNKYNL